MGTSSPGREPYFIVAPLSEHRRESWENTLTQRKHLVPTGWEQRHNNTVSTPKGQGDEAWVGILSLPSYAEMIFTWFSLHNPIGSTLTIPLEIKKEPDLAERGGHGKGKEHPRLPSPEAPEIKPMNK